jgi:hypothetical protein
VVADVGQLAQADQSAGVLGGATADGGDEAETT